MEVVRDKRQTVINFRCTQSEKDFIKSLADENNLKIAEFLRMLIDDYCKSKNK